VATEALREGNVVIYGVSLSKLVHVPFRTSPASALKGFATSPALSARLALSTTTASASAAATTTATATTTAAAATAATAATTTTATTTTHFL
jgi:hypothetical protein